MIHYFRLLKIYPESLTLPTFYHILLQAKLGIKIITGV